MMLAMKTLRAVMTAAALFSFAVTALPTSSAIDEATTNKFDDELHIVFLETAMIEQLPIQQAKKAGISVAVVGTGMDYAGFGQKWRLVRDELKKLSSHTMVIVADARDTLLNLPKVLSSGMVSDLLTDVKKSFHEITADREEAVIFGTEFSCCVFALTHAKPADYFDETGTKRVKRACWSGKDDCDWNGSINALPWSDFQLRLAKERNGGVEVADAFLNGGLAIGTAKNLLNIIDLADLQDDEDDQAVFTGLMYRRPDLIMLDYANEIFGTARFALGMKNGGCIFEKSMDKGNLQHKEIKSVPLFLHTPNHFYECLDGMAQMLGEERSEDMKALTKGAFPVLAMDGGNRKLAGETVTEFTLMDGGAEHSFSYGMETMSSCEPYDASACADVATGDDWIRISLQNPCLAAIAPPSIGFPGGLLADATPDTELTLTVSELMTDTLATGSHTYEVAACVCFQFQVHGPPPAHGYGAIAMPPNKLL